MVMSSKKIGRMVGADVDKALADIGASAPKPDMKADDELKKATGPSRNLTRGEAFKLARMKAKLEGKDPSKQVFEYEGKKYHTRLAGEGASRSAPSKPAASTAAKPAATVNKPAASTAAKPAATTNKPAATTNKPAATTNRTPPTANSQSQRFNARAAELSREAQQEARAEKAKGSVGARARLKNLFGFGSAAAERAAKSYTRAAEGAARQERAIASKPKSRSLLLTGDEARKANAKARFESGTLFRAKGGKIDGCAVRGKTRAGRK